MEAYENPLITRYGSQEMSELFSEQRKFTTWRRLWVALAEAQHEMGLPITRQQIDQLKQFQNHLNLETARKKEREVRHDVMAHVHAYGEQCPLAMPILHLGATSCYVGDNTDILLMAEGLKLLKNKLLTAMDHLAAFAEKHKALPTLGFTHFQPAQLTTVGKRAALWLQDLYLDFEEMENVQAVLRLRGVKGTTGTQASFLTLFDGDHDKVKELEQRIVQKLGFTEVYPVTGQTYPRKLDSRVLNLLSSIAQSAYKFSNDLRLLQHLKELEEPFEKEQIGSSAMAYKRNPMRSERISALARYVVVNALNPAITASTQWFERTLDDSANKRIAVPQAFLAVDAVLSLYINIVDGLVVYPKVIERHILEELPFMATETLLMEAVKKGGDRQALHEKIRRYSMEAARRVKEAGEANPLMEYLINDPYFPLDASEITVLMSPMNFIGRAPQQVDDYLSETIHPLLAKHKDALGAASEIYV